MRFPFESDEARRLNQQIAETMYYAALSTSLELAQRDGPYSTFQGSPLSKGLFQFDLWQVTPSDRYDWKALGQAIQSCGVRNSLLIAPMPTASTSQILGNNEVRQQIHFLAIEDAIPTYVLSVLSRILPIYIRVEYWLESLQWSTNIWYEIYNAWVYGTTI